MSFGDIESVDGDQDFNENCVLGRNIDIAGLGIYFISRIYMYIYRTSQFSLHALKQKNFSLRIKKINSSIVY
jgi:hypothetical protein